MDSDQWSVRRLCLEVYHLPEAERDAFLRQHCAERPELIPQVHRLLETITDATVLAIGPLLSPSNAGVPAQVSNQRKDDSVPDERRAFSPGEILAQRFRIIDFISSGGMGEVYSAEDLKLGGKIAIKTVLPHFALHPEIIERFRREISLNLRITHRNVCRVFDLETHQLGDREVFFFTMELLEGETLESWIARHGAASTEEAAPIVRQFLAGLRAAHRVNVIHQDFKPSNVFLVPEPDGMVRAVVMDFGLALLPGPHRSIQPSDLIGTPIYMAPEQLEGRESSLSSDIYAVGLVLYEMITGQKPFPSTPTASPMLRTKERPLPPRELAPGLDERWEKVILSCLSPDPARRPSSVGEILRELGLEDLPAERTSRFREFAKAVALAVFFSALSGFVIWFANRPGEKVENLTMLTSETDLSGDPSLSRDGRTIAYESDRAQPGNLDIWIQPLPNGSARRITTDPAEDDDANLSPDGKQVAFHSDRKGGGIYVADVAGGPERLLAPFGWRPKFSPDGKEITFWNGQIDTALPSGQVFTVAASGHGLRRLATDFADARYPVWSPDGRWILFTGCRDLNERTSLSACQEWWVTSPDGRRVAKTRVLEELRRERILPRYWPSGWFPEGVLFSGYRDNKADIWCLPLSPDSLKRASKPSRIVLGLSSAVDPTLAVGGTIAFGQMRGAVHIWKLSLDAEGRARESLKLTNDTLPDHEPAISQDGRLLVSSRGGKNHRDIWLKDLVSGHEAEILGPSDQNVHPAVSLDGRRIAFEADNANGTAIYLAGVDKPAQLLCTGCEDPITWFASDRALLFVEASRGTIEQIDLTTRKVSNVLARPGYRLSDANWNARTEYLAFTASRQNEHRQIFVVKLPARTGVVEDDWIPVTGADGWSDNPRWSVDGNILYFASNRDSFTCIWGQSFDPAQQRFTAEPFVVAHFHDPHSNPGLLVRSDFAMSVSADAIILNSGEAAETVWLGVWKPRGLFSFR